jgi:hypothetical protein
VETFLKNNDSVIPRQQIFRRHFNIGRYGTVPDRNTIKNLVQKFRTTASATNKNLKAESELCGHRRKLSEHEPLSVIAPNNQHVDIQLPSTYRADRSDGYFIVFTLSPCHPYQLHIVREMSDREFASRSAFCEQFVTLVNEHSAVIRQVIMSDEAHFELPGCVNKQNRSAANPNELHVKPLHNHSGTVRSGILAFGVIGPYFFEDETGNSVTMTSDRYVYMVNKFLLPELRRRDIDHATFWFQKYVATALTTRQSMNTLRTVFEHHIISRYGDISWPARSPDLSACDFFSWGYL